MEKILNFDQKKDLDGELIDKLKIILLGCAEVGKTSLIMQYMNNNFREEYYPTKNIVYTLI
jgi:GTPase SAR1 family protein